MPSKKSAIKELKKSKKRQEHNLNLKKMLKKEEKKIASLHILEIEKKDLKKDFIDKIKRLKDKNFNIPVTMVIWPPLIKEMDTIFKEFADKEIYILPRAFTGIFKNKRYPESYTEEESKKLEFYNQIYEKNKKPNSIKIIKKDTSIKTNKGKNRFYGELSFQGAPCLAGSKHIVIHENGEVMKCFSNNSSLGNIFKGKINLFDKPQICDSKKCYCFHEGLLFSLKNPKILGGKSLEDIRVSIQSLSKKLNKLK